MALFRISAAVGVLLVVAPEPTLRVARGLFGMADEAASARPAAAEAALAYCRSNPDVCLDAARRAAQVKGGRS